MIGRAFRSADDTRRARVWQGADGLWDWEAVRRLPKGGWYTSVAPAGDNAEQREWSWGRDLHTVMMHVGDELLTNLREQPEEITVDELTDGWPPKPAPYRAPADAPPIAVGQRWQRGRQVTEVISYDPPTAERQGQITTRNIYGAKEPTGRQIQDRKPAEWTYGEQAFREKFRLATVADVIRRGVNGGSRSRRRRT